MKKLLIIDNKFFNRLINVEYFISAFSENLHTDNYKQLFGQNSKIIYINNNDTKYDEKYKVNESIEIKNNLSEINLNEFDLVIYANIPFFVMNNMVFEQIAKQNLDSNKIYSQEGYNLFFKNINNQKRFLYSKAKVNQLSNISNLLIYLFKPENLTVNNQEELLKKLHKNNPQVIIEFINTGTFENSNLFLNEDEYINLCFDNLDEVETLGNYIINFNNESENFKKENFYKFVEKLMNDNTKITLEIKSTLDILDYFSEKIEEDESGELKVVTNCNADISRLNISSKDTLYYDSGNVNGVINLDDLSVKYLFTGENPKFIKIYNKNYRPLYKISKKDLEDAKTISIKRTMGMGDALLALVFAYKIYKQYGKKVNFYSMYNFEKYTIENFIDKYYYIDGSSIYKDINNGEDIFIDFDLAYENLLDNSKPSFYDCYKQLFEDDTLDFDNRNDKILKTSDNDENIVVCNFEGSGWGGKEINMGLADSITKYLSDKKYIVAELGRNNISHYAQITNPEENLDLLFETIGKSKYYFGLDSGILHIANLMGKKCFSICGSADSMKTQFNLDNLYTVGNRSLLCFGCRNSHKGARTLSDGTNTFVTPCYNEKQQYQCMNDLKLEDILTDLENFLIKYDLE